MSDESLNTAPINRPVVACSLMVYPVDIVNIADEYFCAPFDDVNHKILKPFRRLWWYILHFSTVVL